MKLSIITINYNNRDGLQKTIDSVISQTWRDFEWIIIDGGSTDGSKELIEKYHNNFTYWCSEPDKGIYNAMNKGIGKANGEYVLFLNSGDYLYDKKVIKNVWPYLKENDFITGRTIITHNDGSVDESNPASNLTVYMIVNYYLSHPSTFIHSELLKKRGYREDLKIVSDWEQQLYELVFHDATYMPIPFIISEFSEDGISSTNKECVKQERKQVYEEYFSNRLLMSIIGDNEMKQIINHVEVDTFLYKALLISIKCIRKMCNLLKL